MPRGNGGSWDGASTIPGGPYAGGGQGQVGPGQVDGGNGTDNTGGGGGGTGGNPGAIGGVGGAGGSGVVILRYQIGSVETQKASGGSIQSFAPDSPSPMAGKTVHTFENSGIFKITTPISNVEILQVAGGGSGGMHNGAGGGAGGLLYSPSTPVNPSPGEYTITVGGGGAGSVPKSPVVGPYFSGKTGSQTTTGILPACYGGGGGGGNQPDPTGFNGGSGGGGSDGRSGGDGVYPGSPFVDAPRQGYPGGSGQPTAAGGGGGAGAVGANASSADAGNGGAGLPYSISGSATFYAGGGGGGCRPGGTAGTGGSSIGGAGLNSPWETRAGDGARSTGSGGGGGAADPGNGSGGTGNGGGGIVIIAYPT